jgi:hypothetical protein
MADNTAEAVLYEGKDEVRRVSVKLPAPTHLDLPMKYGGRTRFYLLPLWEKDPSMVRYIREQRLDELR